MDPGAAERVAMAVWLEEAASRRRLVDASAAPTSFSCLSSSCSALCACSKA